MRILHVTDCLNAGVKTAIEKILLTESKYEHSILYRVHSDSPLQDGHSIIQKFHHAWKWNSGFLLSLFHLRKVIREYNPDCIHLHSSFAGFIGRLLPTNSKLIYSPHGFSFQKLDVHFLIRLLFRYIERILMRNTDVFVAHWPIELALSEKYLKYKETRFFPLVELDQLETLSNRYSSDFNPNKLLSLGRISAAKDPAFFIEIAKYLYPLGFEMDWIGKNSITDKFASEVCKETKVNWREWLTDRESINYELKSSLAIVITSRWEAGPLVFYEALQNGTPVICRNIPAVRIIGIDGFSSAEDFKNEILRLRELPKYREKLFHNQIRLVNNFLHKLTLKYSDEIYL